MTITPLSHQPAWNMIPNTSIVKRPLLIYHGAMQSATASAFEKHFGKIDVVTPQWRYTMYTTSHFHSTTHEVLGVASGSAELCFGHERNPSKVVEKVTAGDVVIIPAGVSHQLLQDLDGGFQMVGCYPDGCTWDMWYGREGEEDKVKSIADLSWFDRDPVYGATGPALDT